MERTIGEIKPNSSTFEWKIKNFESLSDKPNKSYESPPFDFCGATWCIVMDPNYCTYITSYISLYLKKLNCHEISHTIFQKIAIKRGGGTNYICRECTGTHDKSKQQWGYREFLERYKVLQVAAADCALTISYNLSWNKSVHNVASTAVSTKCKDELLEDKVSKTKENDAVNNEDSRVIIDSEKLLQDMETLFSTGQDSDITLVVQDRKFPVHRLILGIRSPVFAAMFKHDMEEKTSGIVNIADFDPEVLHEFLLYLYTAKVEKLSSKTAVSLYSVADKYDTQELKTKCVEFMRDNMSLDIFCSVVSLALEHEEQSLLEAATKFFVKNLKQIIMTVEWLAFMKENTATANELLVKASNFYVPPEQ